MTAKGTLESADANALASALAAGKGAGPQSAPGGGRPFFCGDIDMRIARDGTWYYLGSPIGRKPLVKLFASVLRREANGDYFLRTPVEICRIKVDDAPFVAVDVDVEGAGPGQRLVFRTNIDDVVTADRDHPIRISFDAKTAEPSPYVMLRDGLEALIARSVYYRLVAMGEERVGASGQELGVWSSGCFFSLGRLEHEGAA